MKLDLLEKAYVHLKGIHQVNMLLLKEPVSFIEVREILETGLHDYPPELHHKVAGFTPTFFLYAKCIDL